jgi:transposase
MATTAAYRRGFTPTVAPMDRPSFHVEGRDNSAAEPDRPVLHSTRGYSREPRPDLTPGMLDLIVDHPAGIPRLMPPRSGHPSDASDCGHVVTEHIAQLPTTHGTADRVAESALYTEENLQTLATTPSPWLTRVPATWTEAQASLAKAAPRALESLLEGDRDHAFRSTDGGVAPRWVLIYAAHRRPQAQRTVDKALRQQRAEDVKAFKPWCRPAVACEADAHQALTAFVQGLQATRRPEVTIRATPRDATRGRPGQAMRPAAQGYEIDGALASS